jgi:hypothetical protein
MSIVHGYRRLLRSVDVAFAGDKFAIVQSRKQLRIEFETKHEGKSTDEIMRDINDVDDMLRFHIVQGTKGEAGNFGKFCFYSLYLVFRYRYLKMVLVSIFLIKLLYIH